MQGELFAAQPPAFDLRASWPRIWDTKPACVSCGRGRLVGRGIEKCAPCLVQEWSLVPCTACTGGCQHCYHIGFLNPPAPAEARALTSRVVAPPGAGTPVLQPKEKP